MSVLIYVTRQQFQPAMKPAFLDKPHLIESTVSRKLTVITQQYAQYYSSIYRM